MYDYLVVGAGLSGATAAHQLWRAGKRVLVIERRSHVAGNCYDEQVDGIWVHRHGGHIFHTNSERVWRFANLFTTFRQYEHRVKACRNHSYYSFPPNRMTAEQIGFSQEISQGIREVAYRELFYKEFSEKAWGRKWEEIPAEIRGRVPIRDSWDDRYFTDRFQGLPEDGYTRMVQNMLKHIPVELEADYLREPEYFRGQAGKVIYTGALDELLDNKYGKLEYRSLKFETKRIEQEDYQGCPTINYPAREVPYTVVNEWKHYGWQDGKGNTVITIQTPAAEGEPYYPYVDEANRRRHAQYEAALELGIIPAGRLGKFQYLNMDQAIAAALALVEKELQNFTTESTESTEKTYSRVEFAVNERGRA